MGFLWSQHRANSDNAGNDVAIIGMIHARSPFSFGGRSGEHVRMK